MRKWWRVEPALAPATRSISTAIMWPMKAARWSAEHREEKAMCSRTPRTALEHKWMQASRAAMSATAKSPISLVEVRGVFERLTSPPSSMAVRNV
eukprot:scaffold145358_cov32-Tisochrysis_lutea.AAC.3